MGIEVVNLPGYSPDLNPIERLWDRMRGGHAGFLPRQRGAVIAACQAFIERINRDPIALINRLWPKFELDPELKNSGSQPDRGLTGARETRYWMERHALSHERLEQLVANEVRLSRLREGSRGPASKRFSRCIGPNSTWRTSPGSTSRGRTRRPYLPAGPPGRQRLLRGRGSELSGCGGAGHGPPLRSVCNDQCAGNVPGVGRRRFRGRVGPNPRPVPGRASVRLGARPFGDARRTGRRDSRAGERPAVPPVGRRACLWVRRGRVVLGRDAARIREPPT